MEMPPKISIITVVYNARSAFEKTVQSVICQSFKNKEFIVIDGGSADGTLDIIRQYQAQISIWISEPDNGIYDAMNKGLKYAKGEYVTFLNAGDFYCDDTVLSRLFAENLHEHVVYGDIFVDSVSSKPSVYLRARDFTLEKLLMYGTGVVCHQAIFVKREIAPIYDTSYKFKSELNWYFDIVEANNPLTFVHKDLPVVHYSLGGFGYANYKRNLFELCRLIIKRYGIRTFIKYKYPKNIYKKIKHRYPKWFLK
jgi:glycosyltransferase involved in cell wall biosynthesis